MSKELHDWIRKSLQSASIACENSADLSKCSNRPGGLAQLLRYSVHQYPKTDNGEVLWCDMADKSCFIVARVKPEVWKGLHGGIVKHLGGLFTIKRINILYTQIPSRGQAQAQEPQLCIDVLELSVYQSHLMPDQMGMRPAALHNQLFAWRKNLLIDYYDRQRLPSEEEIALAWGDFDINDLAQFIPEEWKLSPDGSNPLSHKSSTQSSIPNPSFEYRGTPEEQIVHSTRKIETKKNKGKGKEVLREELQTQLPVQNGVEEESPSSSWERHVRESSYASTQADGGEIKGDETVVQQSPVQKKSEANEQPKSSGRPRSVPAQAAGQPKSSRLSAPAEFDRSRLLSLTLQSTPTDNATPRPIASFGAEHGPKFRSVISASAISPEENVLPVASTSTALADHATDSTAARYRASLSAFGHTSQADGLPIASTSSHSVLPQVEVGRSSEAGISPTSEHSYRSTKSRRPTSAPRSDQARSQSPENFRSTKTRTPTGHPTPRRKSSTPSEKRSSPPLAADTSNYIRARALPFVDFDHLLSPPPEAQRKGRKSMYKDEYCRVIQSESAKELRECPAIERNRTPSWSVSPQVRFPAQPNNRRATNESEVVTEPAEQEMADVPIEADQLAEEAFPEPNMPVAILSTVDAVEATKDQEMKHASVEALEQVEEPVAPLDDQTASNAHEVAQEVSEQQKVAAEPVAAEKESKQSFIQPENQTVPVGSPTIHNSAEEQATAPATVHAELSPEQALAPVIPDQDSLVNDDSEESLLYVDQPKVDKGKARAIDPMDVDEKPILDSAQPRASTSAQPYSQSVEKQSGDDDIVLLDGPPTTKKVRKANDDKAPGAAKRQKLSFTSSRSKSRSKSITSQARRSTPTSAPSHLSSHGDLSKAANGAKSSPRSATPHKGQPEKPAVLHQSDNHRGGDAPEAAQPPLPAKAEGVSEADLKPNLSYAAQARLALERMKYTSRGTGSRRTSAAKFKQLAESMN